MLYYSELDEIYVQIMIVYYTTWLVYICLPPYRWDIMCFSHSHKPGIHHEKYRACLNLLLILLPRSCMNWPSLKLYTGCSQRSVVWSKGRCDMLQGNLFPELIARLSQYQCFPRSGQELGYYQSARTCARHGLPFRVSVQQTINYCL